MSSSAEKENMSPIKNNTPPSENSSDSGFSSFLSPEPVRKRIEFPITTPPKTPFSLKSRSFSSLRKTKEDELFMGSMDIQNMSDDGDVFSDDESSGSSFSLHLPLDRQSGSQISPFKRRRTTVDAKRCLFSNSFSNHSISHENVSIRSRCDLTLSTSFENLFVSKRENKNCLPFAIVGNHMKSLSDSPISTINELNVFSSTPKRELTGDFARSLTLPLVHGKHPDLNSISVHTMAALLNGEFNQHIATFQVLDCRYPYEYEGGHMKNAINWPNLKMVQDFVNAQKSPPKAINSDHSRHVYIFHCEFSAERGPKAQRMLRERDRSVNEKHYPALHFPEIYLLEGGYKAFYESYPDLCTPSNYVRMFDETYKEHLKFYRSKSRLWASTSTRKHHTLCNSIGKPGTFKL